MGVGPLGCGAVRRFDSPLSALFRWVVYDIALLIAQALISLMDKKVGQRQRQIAPNP